MTDLPALAFVDFGWVVIRGATVLGVTVAVLVIDWPALLTKTARYATGLAPTLTVSDDFVAPLTSCQVDDPVVCCCQRTVGAG